MGYDRKGVLDDYSSSIFGEHVEFFLLRSTTAFCVSGRKHVQDKLLMHLQHPGAKNVVTLWDTTQALSSPDISAVCRQHSGIRLASTQ